MQSKVKWEFKQSVSFQMNMSTECLRLTYNPPLIFHNSLPDGKQEEKTFLLFLQVFTVGDNEIRLMAQDRIFSNWS